MDNVSGYLAGRCPEDMVYNLTIADVIALVPAVDVKVHTIARGCGYHILPRCNLREKIGEGKRDGKRGS